MSTYANTLIQPDFWEGERLCITPEFCTRQRVFSQGEAAEVLRGQWGKAETAGNGTATNPPITAIPASLPPSGKGGRHLVCSWGRLGEGYMFSKLRLKLGGYRNTSDPLHRLFQRRSPWKLTGTKPIL